VKEKSISFDPQSKMKVMCSNKCVKTSQQSKVSGGKSVLQTDILLQCSYQKQICLVILV